MRSAVFFKDGVGEVFDAEAKAGDADVTERVDLRLLQRSRFALESDFLGLVPVDVLAQFADEPMQLFDGEVRRGAAAEVNEVKLSSLHGRLPREDADLLRQCIDV